MTASRTGFDYVTHGAERPIDSVITIDEPIRATLEELQILTIGQLALAIWLI